MEHSINAKKVAKYILCMSDPDIGDIISNLKLQKLVYYAQGFHLALFDKPLFNDKIEAWEHGPVVPELYREYKEHCSGAIPPPDIFDDSIFTEEQKDLLKEVYEVFGQFSAWKLRNMTHSEPPWTETPINSCISHDKMKEYFVTKLK
ncbi:MAG: SocA family protein [bacterium]|nr:SocA family protein [bacterium]